MADNSSGPNFAAYVVEEREGKDPFWTRIGSAWAHKDGDGYNITLSALPINGRLVLRKPKLEEDKEPEAKPQPRRK
jgi:hypothetical protein